jgi:SAM-dependent methyltransferase
VRAIRSSGVIVARSGTNPDCHTNPELPKPGRWTPGGFGPQHREMTLYDSIGRTYASRRRTDPRIEAAIIAALSDASSVVNVGAGSGSYEPASTIAAIEPSSVMIAQRPPGSAPVLQAVAERIPLRDQCADAAMALLTVHHWTNVAAGVAELRRIARRRLVFLTWRPAELARYWIADYLPESALIDATSERPVKALTDLLPEARLLPVPIPHDCLDGFGAAYWRRPNAYLDPHIRAGISFFARATEDELRPGLQHLADDLRTGRWHAAHADLPERDSLDLGYCLLIADL